MTQPRILITSRAPDEIVARLKQHGSVIVGEDPAKGMPRSEVLRHVANVVAIINQNELTIDLELLQQAPRLKIVSNTAAGFDNMDVGAMRTRGVWGTNCPESYAADTATHTIALLLALTRRLIEADRYVRSGQWRHDGWTPGGRWDGVSLAGKRLGLIGYGNIGRQVAQRARAFGMSIRHHTRSHSGDPEWLPLEDLIATSDVVSLHCPLSPSTRHLIDGAALAAMKPTAILLNVSRGPVVDIASLVNALQKRQIAGAGLDVFEFEPDVPPELVNLPNVVLSPHMGGCTAEARMSAWQVCVENVERVLSGRPPATPVFPLDTGAAIRGST